MKRILSIILCMIMIAATLCSCKFVKPSDNSGKKGDAQTESTSGLSDAEAVNGGESGDETSENEEITVFVTDQNGEYVTNKDGKMKTEIFNVAELEKQLEDELSKQDATAPTKANAGTSKSDSPSSIIGDTQSAKEDLLPAGQKVNDTTIMKTTVEPVFKSGTYTIKGSIKAESQTMNTTIAFRNNAKEYAVVVALGAFSVKVFSIGGKYYMALPMFAKYAEVSQDEVGDMSEMTETFKSTDSTYVKTTTVKDGKNTYTCEEYKSGTSTIKYYFNANKEWKRMEVVDGEDILVWEITSFTNKAEDSLFSTKGMIKDNSMLEGMF